MVEARAFDAVSRTLQDKGPAAALDEAADLLKKAGEYHRAFDVLLMKARLECGLPVLASPTSADMTPAVRDSYENKIMEVCRGIGATLLERRDFAGAWQYFRMIGESEPMRAALDAFQLPADEESESGETIEAIVDIAIAQGVHPYKGLQIVLDRYGTCQAITSCEGMLATGRHPDHASCVTLLVRRLHSELIDRLRADIESREGKAPAGGTVGLLIKDRPQLFEGGNYHIDTSHLSSVVRMARMLPKGEEMFLAMQLCEYGAKLEKTHRYPDQPPFEDAYPDSLAYFKIISGIEVDAGLERFKQKALTANPDEVGTLPAEVYVSLLRAAGKIDEAVAFAARKLNYTGPYRNPALALNDLCQNTGRFEDMAKLAAKRGDLITYVGALIAKADASAGTPPAANPA